jgi:hypothetical protein
MKYLVTLLIALLITSSALSAHELHAPHGGTLVELGEEFARMELVLDPGTGTLTGYALDGEAENPARIEQGDIEIRITAVNTQGEGASKTTYILNLEPVPDVLTGETVGDTSEFTARSDKLKRAQSFDGVISAINIKGQSFKDVKFRFPEGNE